jgi:hypothetical protein
VTRILFPPCARPASLFPGQWADHRGLLDFNLLTGDWPDALPDTQGAFPRWASGPAIPTRHSHLHLGQPCFG